MSAAVRGRADRGSLPLALLVVIVAGGLVALLIPMLTVQIGSTAFAQSRTRELAAARAGLAAGVGALRSAGSVADLPCGPGGGPTGAIDSGAAAPSYAVTVDYYGDDPHGRSAQWRAAQALACPPAVVPQFAVITSTGTDSRATRTLQSVYTFTNGGTIALWPLAGAGTGPVCLDAGGTEAAAPQAGDAVSIAPCGFDGDAPAPTPGQVWFFTAAGRIELVESRSTGALCLDVLGAARALVLASCASASAWGVGPSGRLTEGGACLDGGDVVPGGAAGLALAACTSPPDGDRRQRWVLAPATGAGTAAAPARSSASNYHQLVNYATSRCIDASASSPSEPGGVAVTARMCGSVTADALATSLQGVTFDAATKQLRIGGAGLCLRAPQTPARSADDPAGAVVTLAACAVGDARTVWRLDGAAHTVADAGGDCLSAATTTAAYVDGFPRLITQACDGSTLQQWTARLGAVGLTDLREIPPPVP